MANAAVPPKANGSVRTKKSMKCVMVCRHGSNVCISVKAMQKGYHMNVVKWALWW